MQYLARTTKPAGSYSFSLRAASNRVTACRGHPPLIDARSFVARSASARRGRGRSSRAPRLRAAGRRIHPLRQRPRPRPRGRPRSAHRARVSGATSRPLWSARSCCHLTARMASIACCTTQSLRTRDPSRSPTARGADDVARCVDFATAREVPLAARSGGHSYAGFSTCDGLVIDVSRLADISVDTGVERRDDRRGRSSSSISITS